MKKFATCFFLNYIAGGILVRTIEEMDKNKEKGIFNNVKEGCKEFFTPKMERRPTLTDAVCNIFINSIAVPMAVGMVVERLMSGIASELAKGGSDKHA